VPIENRFPVSPPPNLTPTVTKASHARSLPFRLQRRNVRSQTQSLDSGSSKSAKLSHHLHSTSDQALTTVYSTWIHFVQSHQRFLATRHPDPATKRTPPSKSDYIHQSYLTSTYSRPLATFPSSGDSFVGFNPLIPSARKVRLLLFSATAYFLSLTAIAIPASSCH
jgi:hypothetical protein